MENSITFDDVLSDDFKPKIIPVHEKHTRTFFSEEQLANDPEAREIEAKFSHGRAPSVEINSSLLKDQLFYSIDEFGNKIPSINAISTFNEYGVNEQGLTVTQAMEQEREAKGDFEEYCARFINLQVQMQRIKTDLKALDIEFKDLGVDVSACKRAIKRSQKFKEMTQEERWIEGVMLNWALNSPKLSEALDQLEQAKLETKEAGSDKDARHRTQMLHVKKHADARYEHDKKTNRGALDNAIEKQAMFASYGVDRAEEQFIRLEESKRVRDERREAGLPDLAMHSNELQPANPSQHFDVFDEEFHKRREAFEAKKREERIFDPSLREKDWELDYEPTDVPVIIDFNELAKHGIYQAQRLQDSAFIIKRARKGEIAFPDEKWVEKFKDVSNKQLEQLIMQGANVEDYLDNKIICDQLYLPMDDPRRDDWQTPDMKIARYNRLQRTKRIPGDYLDYDVRRADLQEHQLPVEIRKPFNFESWFV